MINQKSPVNNMITYWALLVFTTGLPKKVWLEVTESLLATLASW
ncbi:hypothetical protein MKX62_11225 [Sporosarcina sp. FSL K6-5500]